MESGASHWVCSSVSGSQSRDLLMGYVRPCAGLLFCAVGIIWGTLSAVEHLSLKMFKCRVRAYVCSRALRELIGSLSSADPHLSPHSDV